MLDVLRFEPVLKRARWGGRRLRTSLHKLLGPESDYAESWELVDHGTEQTHVSEGPWQGKTLSDLTREFPRDLFGPRHAFGDSFPLLIKFLDAHDLLSVQVHPNDEQAAKLTPPGRGKTEAWYILDAAPEGSVYAGFHPGTTPEDVTRALQADQIADLLVKIDVQRGDTLLIPAGTVHALGKGVLLLEVQQSSDITFRLYDWGRVGADGKPRPIHVAESLQCLNFQSQPALRKARPMSSANSVEELARSDYFIMLRRIVYTPLSIDNEHRCRIVTVIAGEGMLITSQTRHSLRIGDTLLVPACVESFRVEPSRNLEFVETLIP